MNKISDFLRNKKLWALALTVTVFACFFAYLLQQHSYIYLYHDDYGYATLSYVYWEPNIVGQHFSLSQMVHYLSMHYQQWGGRVLSFAQEILLFKAGTGYMRLAQSAVITAIFVLIYRLVRKSYKGKTFLLALGVCALFGFISANTAKSGIYWYSASIAYLFPTLYLMAGAYVFYKVMFDTSPKAFTLSKLLMLPGAMVLFFFAGFSMEQIGAGAVVCTLAIMIGSMLKNKKPWPVFYGLPVIASAVVGYIIMLVAPGNFARQGSGLYKDYYAMDFMGQLTTSGKNIVNTIFSSSNLLMEMLIFSCAGIMAYLIIKSIKNLFSRCMNAITLTLSGILLLCALSPSLNAVCFVSEGFHAAVLWIYVVFVSITVTQWLLAQRTSADRLIWYLFLAGLVTQAAALLSPVFFDRCALVFDFIWLLVTARLMAYLLDKATFSTKNAPFKMAIIIVPIVLIAIFNLGPTYFGYQQNAPVNEYNNQSMVLASQKVKEGMPVRELQLMKVPNSKYTETQPYDRELIQDWMRIYYNIPKTVKFTYNDYDAEQFALLQQQLTDEQKKMNAGR